MEEEGLNVKVERVLETPAKKRKRTSSRTFSSTPVSSSTKRSRQVVKTAVKMEIPPNAETAYPSPPETPASMKVHAASYFDETPMSMTRRVTRGRSRGLIRVE